MSTKVLKISDRRLSSVRIRRKPVNAKLSPAERDGLTYFGRLHVLSPDEFRLADGGCGETKAKEALKGLLEKGLVGRAWMRRERTSRQKRLGQPRGQDVSVYKLTPAGHKRGVREGLIDTSVKAPGKAWDGDDAPRDIKHRLKIVRMMIEVYATLESDKTRFLTMMVPDFLIVNRRKATCDDVKKGQQLTADLIFEIERKDGSSSTMFFVEVQKTRLQANSQSKTRPTVGRKLAPYGDYLKNTNRKFQGASQSIVLYVADENAGWFDDIVPAIDWEEVGEVRKIVRLSTFEDIAGDVFGEVWLDCAGEKRRIIG